MKNFTALRTIAIIFKVSGFIALTLTAIVILFTIVNPGLYLNVAIKGITIAATAIVGFLVSLLLFSFSEMILLFIQIEINTRPINSIQNNVKKEENPSGSKLTETEKSETFKNWRNENPKAPLSDFYSYLKTLG